MRARHALSVGVIVALVTAVWVAITAGDEEPAVTTTSLAAAATSTTSTTLLPSTTTTSAVATTTTAPDTTTTSNEQARIEEVRLILEDLYFRWFDAIYRNDEKAVREAIATERYLADFHNAVQNLQLPSAPLRSEIKATDVEILRDSSDCLVTYSTLDLSGWRGEGSLITGVNVLLRVAGQWRLATAWTNRNDLWEQDCEIEPEL